MPSKKGKKSARAAGMAKKSDVLPYPVVVTPPADPPTCVTSPKKHVSVAYQADIGPSHEAKLMLSTIRSQLSAASGIPTTKLFFVIEYCFAWASAGADVDISLVDTTYGIQAIDSGSYATRARAGIRYPKTVQKTYYPGMTDEQLYDIGSGSDVKADFRVGVTCWSIV